MRALLICSTLLLASLLPVAPARAMPAEALAQLTSADDHPKQTLAQMQRRLATARAAGDEDAEFWWSIAATRVLMKLERQAEAAASAATATRLIDRFPRATEERRLWLQLAQLDSQGGWESSAKLLPLTTALRQRAQALGAERLACETVGLETWLLIEMHSDDEAWISAELQEQCGQRLQWAEQVAFAQLSFAQLARRRLSQGASSTQPERHLEQAVAALGDRPARFLRSLIEWDTGILLRHQNQLPPALQRLDRVRGFSQDLQDDAGVAAANLEMATVLLKLDQPLKTLPLIDEAQRLINKVSAADGAYRMQSLMEVKIQALTQLRSPELPAALDEGQRWLDQTRTSGHRPELERAMAEGLNALGRPGAAYERLRSAMATEQAVRGQARDSQVQRLQARYDTARRDAENAALKLKGEAARLQLQAVEDRRQTLTAGLVALAALSVLGFSFGGRELAQRRRMAALALRDELTGQPNRRAVQAYAQEQLAQALRLGLPFSLAVIDLDHFKQVNDRFGHATGDAVLRAFAHSAGAVLRGQDRMGRWGGEEWLLVMPGTRLDEIAGVFERLRQHAAGGDIPNAPAEARCTFSMGAAELAPDRQTVDALVAAADEALYRAKAEGRDRLALAPLSSPDA